MKPKLLTYIKDRKGNIVGKALGIFITYENLSEDIFIDTIVKGVEKYREKETQSIIFEDARFLNNNNIDIIEEKTGLKIVDGKKVLIKFLPLVLKELFLEIGEESINYEVLLITSGIEDMKPLLKELSKMIRFLTVFAERDISLEKIKEEILLETGLSIYCTNNIDKTLANYYIIINLSNNISLNVGKLKHKGIIFDFSNNNNISEELRQKNKKSIVIDDFVFENNNLFIEDDHIVELTDVIPSRLYELNNDLNKEDFKGFMVEGKKYSTKGIVST